MTGAGGAERLAGDYVYGNHRLPYREAGQWGVFRVRRPGVVGVTTLRALPGGCGPSRPCRPGGSGSDLGLVAALTVALLGGFLALGAAKRQRDARLGQAGRRE